MQRLKWDYSLGGGQHWGVLNRLFGPWLWSVEMSFFTVFMMIEHSHLSLVTFYD